MASKRKSNIEDISRELRGESERERLLHRLHSVAVVLHGRSASEAARIYGDSPRAVAYWVTRFKQSGIAGLRSEPKPGRPAALSKRNRDILRAAMSRRKKELKPVTARVIAQYIKRRFNVEVTERHCFRILKQLRT